MSMQKHPFWEHARYLVRTYDKAKLLCLSLGEKYLLTVQAGHPWPDNNYEPSKISYDDFSEYTHFQCCIYVGTNLSDNMSFDDLLTQLQSTKLRPIRDFEFDRHGIKYGTSYWTGADGALGKRVPKSLVEMICDYLIDETGHKFEEKKTVVAVPQRVKCRACDDADAWNGPDFIGDGMYTCYRCRNHPFVSHKNVPESMQDSFDSYYAGIDRYTCK
jgi:hypothetical protein